MESSPIVIERVFAASIEKVWQAITDKDQMKEWYINVPEFKPESGLEFQFLEGDDKEKYLHKCKILEVIDHKKITYSWRYDGYTGNSFVTFELFEEGSNTRLKLTHDGVETFPASKPELSKVNHESGWKYLIGKALKEYLDK